MSKYKMWDKQEDIWTIVPEVFPEGHPRFGQPPKGRWSAEEYIEEHAPWAANPNCKVIVGGGDINGTVFMNFNMTV